MRLSLSSPPYYEHLTTTGVSGFRDQLEYKYCISYHRGRVSVRLDRHFCCMDRELDVEEEIVRATYVAQKCAKHCYPVCASQRGQLVLSICQFVSPVKKF